MEMEEGVTVSFYEVVHTEIFIELAQMENIGSKIY